MALLERAKVETERRKPKPTGLQKWCLGRTPTPKQQLFLDCEADEMLWGGAGSSGKSEALLFGALSHVDEPQYSALMLRNTYTDLNLPSAIMARAHEWLRGTEAVWSAEKRSFRFPSGAIVGFGYLENDQDRFRYAGAEFQGLFFDELTGFTEVSYLFMQSRLRRTKSNSIKPYCRAASNPGNRGHRWVKRRFVDPETRAPGAVFIPATLYDNPFIDHDEYVKSLSRLDSTTRAQIRDGIWIDDSSGKMFLYDEKRNKVSHLPALPEGVEWSYCLGIDLGSSQSQPTTAFTVLCWHEFSTKVYCPMSFSKAGMTPTTVAEQVQELSLLFDFDSIVCDAGGLGGGYINEMQTRWHIAVEPAKKSDKTGYRKLFNGALERGDVLLVEGQCDALEQEFQDLQWNAEGTDNQKGAADHASDSACYAWRNTRAHQSTEAPVSLKSLPAEDRIRAEAAEWKRKDEERYSRKQSRRWWERSR